MNSQSSQVISRIVDNRTAEPHRQAVVLSPAEYERLMEAAEDAENLAASDAVMAEIMAGSPTIPWAQVKADLGL